MSKIFNYTKGYDVIKFDTIGACLPGYASTLAPIFASFAGIVADDYVENGQLVKVVRDTTGKMNALTIKGIVANDAATAVAGVVMSDLKGQHFINDSGVQYVYQTAKGQTATVLRNGYIWVPVQNTTPTITKGGTVYMRNVAGAASTAQQYYPIGGIESVADSGKNVALTNFEFTGLVGFPCTGQNNGTTTTGLTGRTAQVKVSLGNL
mgnify:CR=1 FL=1